MMGALEHYAAAGQACIISPFIVGGAMAPVSVAGTLTQVLAEVMAGVAYSQLVRPGAPAIFGAFVTSIDMKLRARPPSARRRRRRSPMARGNWRGGWGCPTARRGPSPARNCPMRRPPMRRRIRSTRGCCRA